MWESLATKLLDRTLTLDSLDISLSNGEDGRPCLRGTGNVSQNEEGDIKCKVYLVNQDEDLLPRFAQRLDTPGKLIEPHNYYSLSFIDTHGAIWKGERLRLGFDGFFNQGIVRSFVDEMRLSYRMDLPPTVNQLTLVYFVDVDIPTNAITHTETHAAGTLRGRSSAADLLKFACDLGRFTLRKEKGKLIVEFNSGEPIGPTFPIRVNEALSFFFARTLEWNVLHRITGGIEDLFIRGRPRCGRKGAPVPFDQTHGPRVADAIRLLASYLAYVVTYPEDNRHPLSRQLHSFHQAWPMTIEARATAAGIAVEGIMRLFPGASAVSDVEIEQLVKHCLNWQGFQDERLKRALHGRVDGSLNQLRQVRPIDKLFELVRRGVVSERHVKAWKSLRNTVAHADPWAKRTTQEMVDLCHVTTILIYQLVFVLVGYVGPYTDYATYGYPDRFYRGRPFDERDVEVAAYYMWLNGGKPDGMHFAHWYRAKQLLTESLI